MKGTRLYIISMLAMAIALFVIGLRLPQRFTWYATYDHNDKQPLGAYVFDSIMAQTMPRGYATLHKSLAQIAADSTLRHSNVLIVADVCHMNDLDFDIMDSLLREGASVMIATTGYNLTLVDSTLAYDYGIALSSEYSLHIKDSLKAWFNNEQDTKHDLATWHTEKGWYGARRFDLPASLVSAHIHTDDDMEQTLHTLASYRKDYSYSGETSRYFKRHAKAIKRLTKAHNETDDSLFKYINNLEGTYLEQPSDLPIAVRREVGRGNLYVVATPMAFTNYCVLDKKTAPYLMRLMSHLADRPLIRTTCYNDAPGEAHSPLAIVLGNPSLRAAYYMLMLTLLLFCLFKARRRQRVIPVVKPPRNYQLEFAQLIGTLYFQRHDNADLVRKKYMLLAEHARAKTKADLMDATADSLTLPLLARHTGMDVAHLRQQIEYVRACCRDRGKPSDKEMYRAIDFMTLLEKRL